VIAARVLGLLEVTVDGGPANVGGLRQRSVLARAGSGAEQAQAKPWREAAARRVGQSLT
jgi:hypothetical protein